MSEIIHDAINKVREYGATINAEIHEDRRKMNRFILLVVGLLTILNYLMICVHIEKYPFDIFPSFPVLDLRDKLTIFLPDTDGTTILEETRIVETGDDPEVLVQQLTELVIKGSIYDNTRLASPITAIGLVRKVWIEGDTCVIDLYPETISSDIQVIPGSQKLFRTAMEKTITANLPDIKKVYILSGGIHNGPLWEMQDPR